MIPVPAAGSGSRVRQHLPPEGTGAGLGTPSLCRVCVREPGDAGGGIFRAEEEKPCVEVHKALAAMAGPLVVGFLGPFTDTDSSGPLTNTDLGPFAPPPNSFFLFLS